MTTCLFRTSTLIQPLHSRFKRICIGDKIVDLSLRQLTVILGLNLSKGGIANIEPYPRLYLLTLIFCKRSTSNRAGDILVHHLVLLGNIQGLLALDCHRGIIYLIAEPKVDRIEPICQTLANYIGVSKAGVQSCKIVAELLTSLGLALIQGATAGFIGLSFDKVNLSLLSRKTKGALKLHVGIIDVGGRNTTSRLYRGGSIGRGIATSSTKGGVNIQACSFVTLTNRIRIIIGLLILVELHLTLPCKLRGFLLVLVLLLKQLFIFLVRKISHCEIHGCISYRIHVGCILI